LDRLIAMHRAIRALHLFCGLCALPLLLLYFASGVQMAHRSWWRAASRVKEQSYTLPKNLDAREVARRLPIHGELERVSPAPDGQNLLIARPGVTIRVSYSSATGEAHVGVTTAGFLTVLTGLHRASGMDHAWLPLNLWSAALALMSLSLTVLGATGLYLWFQARAMRTAGFILLAGGAGMALALSISMRWG
jgi:hypothetical protein